MFNSRFVTIWFIYVLELIVKYLSSNLNIYAYLRDDE